MSASVKNHPPSNRSSSSGVSLAVMAAASIPPADDKFLLEGLGPNDGKNPLYQRGLSIEQRVSEGDRYLRGLIEAKAPHIQALSDPGSKILALEELASLLRAVTSLQTHGADRLAVYDAIAGCTDFFTTPKERIAACEKLHGVDSPNAERALLQAMQNDPNAYVCFAAAHALSTVPHPQYRDAIVNAGRIAEDSLRILGRLARGEISATAAGLEFCELLYQASGRQRDTFEALRYTKDRVVIEKLIDLLIHPPSPLASSVARRILLSTDSVKAEALIIDQLCNTTDHAGANGARDDLLSLHSYKFKSVERLVFGIRNYQTPEVRERCVEVAKLTTDPVVYRAVLQAAVLGPHKTVSNTAFRVLTEWNKPPAPDFPEIEPLLRTAIKNTTLAVRWHYAQLLARAPSPPALVDLVNVAYKDQEVAKRCAAGIQTALEIPENFNAVLATTKRTLVNFLSGRHRFIKDLLARVKNPALRATLRERGITPKEAP